MRPAAPTTTALLLLAAGTAVADEGRIPIHAPTTITQPGRYVVTRNFTGGLSIQASGVHVDLDGHTLTGVALQPVIHAPVGATDLVVEGGMLVGGLNAVYAVGSAAAPVRLILRDVTCRNQSGAGIFVDGIPGRVAIERCRVEEVGGIGILLSGPNPALGGHARIVETMVRSAGDDGIYLYSPTSSEVERCTIVGTADTAITVVASSVIEENVIHGTENGQPAIEVAGTARSSVVRRNVVTANTGAGISIPSAAAPYTVVEGNTVSGNAGCGLFFQPVGCVYRDNVLRDNAGGALCGVATDAGGNVL